MLYHVTPAENLESIIQNGLVPQIGTRSALLGEASESLYLFTSKEACETGLMNWLGDEFDGAELVVLMFDEAGISGCANAGYELACPHTISADLIVGVLDENFAPINFPSANV